MRRANSASEKCGVPSETAPSGAPSATLESERAASRRSSADSCKTKLRRAAAAGGLEVRRFGRDADDMKQRDRARRGGGGAQRLQIVLARRPAGRPTIAGTRPPQRRPIMWPTATASALRIPIVRNRRNLDDRPRQRGFP